MQAAADMNTAKVLLEKGDYKSAEKIGRDALKTSPGDWSAQLIVARCLISENRDSDLRNFFREISKGESCSPLLLIYMSNMYDADGDPVGAENALIRAVEAGANGPDVIIKLATLSWSLLKFERAISLIENCRSQDKKNTILYLMLNDLYSTTTRWDDLVRVLREGISYGCVLESKLGAALLKAERYVEAEEVLMALPDLDPHSQQYFEKYINLALCAAQVGRHADAAARLESALTASAEIGEVTEPMQEAIHAVRRLLDLGGETGAIADNWHAHAGVRLLDKSTSRLASVDYAKLLDEAYGMNLCENLGKRSSKRVPVRPYPSEASRFGNFTNVCERYILRGLPVPAQKIDKNSKIYTFGSCFAENVAIALRARGMQSLHANLGEDINTTFANKHLYQWVAQGEVGLVERCMAAYFPSGTRDTLKQLIVDSDFIVMTIGVGSVISDSETGDYVFVPGELHYDAINCSNRIVLRTTSVEENHKNIVKTINSIREINSKSIIILSLSPVPIFGTTEMHSSVIADCISKSTLRSAIHNVMQENIQSVYYWPSFEMIRWFGAHLPNSIYAEDCRHVRQDIVEQIMTMFHKTFCSPTNE